MKGWMLWLKVFTGREKQEVVHFAIGEEFLSLNIFKLLELTSAVIYIFYLPSHEEMSWVVYLKDGFELAIDVGMSLLVRLDETGQWGIPKEKNLTGKICPWDTQFPNQRDDWYESSNCNFTVPYFLKPGDLFTSILG